MTHEESYFDGGLFQLIGYSILAPLLQLQPSEFVSLGRTA